MSGAVRTKVFLDLGREGAFHDAAAQLANAIYDTAQINGFAGLKPQRHNRGLINGWIGPNAIFGKCISIAD